ncbi:MAG: hypothetical protein SVO01_02940 [Thermotogota bacterium]|nr:hypothetical protein [Thermotogota bacterium]
MSKKGFAQLIDENKVKAFKTISVSTGISPGRLLEQMIGYFEGKNIKNLADFVHIIEK